MVSRIQRNWPVAVAAAFSALLLVMTIAGEAAVRAERSAHIACAAW